MLVRMRIALADRPGALSSVAAVIADHGGNIEAVDVLSGASATGGPSGRAVDDITVAFPGDAPVEELRAAIESTGTGTLVSARDATHRDPVVLVLEWARTLAAARLPDEADAALARAVGELCAAPVSWVERSGATLHPVAAMALAQGGAVVAAADGLTADRAARLPGGGWLLAVPDSTGRTVLAARGGDGYTATEIARIEALMALLG